MTDRPPPGPTPSATYQPILGSNPPRPALPSVWAPAVPLLPKGSYAPWGRRVLASVIDFAPSWTGSIVFMIGYLVLLLQVIPQIRAGATPGVFFNTGMIIGYAIMLLALPWTIYNRWIIGGRTGQSLGKRVTKLLLLSEQTGRPMGAGMAFARDLVHTLDGFAYLGYLWPLWDEKRQTFADKLMQTVVLPAPPLGPATAPDGPRPV